VFGGIGLAAGGDDCPLWQGFDFSAAATNYAQLTGVLAGFAFVAITLMLNRQHRREALGVGDPAEELAQDRRNIAALGCAFLGLLATTVLYASISAERACALTDGRAASDEVLAGVAFAFSLYTLLFAAVQLVSAASLGTHMRFIVAVIVPPIVVMFVLAGLDDLALAMAGPPTSPVPHQPLQPVWTTSSRSFWDLAHTLSLWLPVGAFLVCAVMWWLGRAVRSAEGSPGRPMALALTSLPYVSLALVLYVVWQSTSVITLDPGPHISPCNAWWLVGISMALVVAQSACLSFERGEDHNPRLTRPSEQV
jgi:hypothetical protein